MKLTIDLTNSTECSEALSLIAHYHGTKMSKPVQDERNPPPVTDEPTTYLPEDKPVVNPVPEKKPEWVEPDIVKEAPVEAATMAMLRGAIQDHLMKYEKGSAEIDAEKKALIDILLETAGVGSSATVPEDKLDAAYTGITAYTGAK